jgi:hypothetical protein
MADLTTVVAAGRWSWSEVEERMTMAPGERLTAALEWCLAWWCWFDLSFGIDNYDQGGGELRYIRRNLAPALLVPTTA